MVKKLKKTISHNSSDRDQYTVVLEDIRSQFRAFGEGLHFISDTVSAHTKEFGTIKGELSLVKNTVNAHTKELSNINNTVNAHTKELSNINNTVNAHTKELSNINNTVNAHTKEFDIIKDELALIRHNQVTRDEFKFLEARVARLERARK